MRLNLIFWQYKNVSKMCSFQRLNHSVHNGNVMLEKQFAWEICPQYDYYARGVEGCTKTRLKRNQMLFWTVWFMRLTRVKKRQQRARGGEFLRAWVLRARERSCGQSCSNSSWQDEWAGPGASPPARGTPTFPAKKVSRVRSFSSVRPWHVMGKSYLVLL